MLNAFPIQAFKSLAKSGIPANSMYANASDLPGFDKQVHESGEYQEIVIKAPTGHIAKLHLTHHAKIGSEVSFWEFTMVGASHLKAIIFND